MITIIYRTIFFYFFVTFAYRIMGKREIGQLGIIDLIVSILIAELAAISIENYNSSIFLAIFPVGVLVILELVLGYLSVKYRKFNRLFEGKPVFIINKGRINYKNLIKQRYSIDDLLVELRQKSISSIEEVEYAILENNGKLSIFKYGFLKIPKDIPTPLIVERKIQKETLNNINKTELWLKNELLKNNLSLEDIYYCFYKNKQLFIVKYSS